MALKKSSKFLLILMPFLIFIFCGFSLPTYKTTAKSAIVVDDDGKVYFEKNADEALQIASTTKIVTALTVIRALPDLDREYEVPESAIGVEGSSVYLHSGESLTVRGYLYGLMLRSGNDCAVALAVITAGNVENFSMMMNETAKSCGAVNSHFVTPHGLPCDGQYCTARDLALISANAMQNEEFYKIVSAKEYREKDRYMKNKNKMLFECDGACGIKTGYTKEAGRCLVSAVERNGKRIICVVLNCGPMFEESKKLIEKAFEEQA